MEACKTGRPIIASKSKSNLEMSKKIKMNLFKTHDFKDLSKTILKIWFDRKLIRYQINSKQTIKNYSWNNISNKYLEIFKKVDKKNIF